MCTFASRLPLPAVDQARFDQELAGITAIYRRLFDDRAIELVLLEGRDPKGTRPVVLENDLTFRPHHLKANFLGHVVLPAPFPHARPVAAALTIPPEPTPGERDNDTPPWRVQRPLRPLYRLWPFLYERIRYGAEMLRKKRSVRHDWTPMVFGRGRQAVTPEPAADKRPAILIGFHWLEVGGAEKMAFDTVTWALEAGLRVFVVASVPAVQRLAGKLPDHPDVRFIRLDRYLPHEYWPRFTAKLIRDENIRLIHLHHCQALYDSLAHIRVAAPPVTVIDTTHIVEYADGGFPRISGVWTNYIDLHHVISNQLADVYRDRFHAGDKVRLGRMLNRAPAEIALPPMSMAAGGKVLNVAFVGRYSYQKRPLVMIEILRRLAGWARRHKVQLNARLVGDGAFRPAAEALVQRYKLQEVVTFLPPDTDVPALLEQSDILLLPSNNEGLALVCYEAIEHGCIPISTDVGAQAELIPPDLLVPLSPGPCARASVSTVARLHADPGFLASQSAALRVLYRKVSADPTAKEVLMPLYLAAARGEDIPA